MYWNHKTWKLTPQKYPSVQYYILNCEMIVMIIYCLYFFCNSSDSYGHVTIQSKPLPYSDSVHCKLLTYSSYFVGDYWKPWIFSTPLWILKYLAYEKANLIKNIHRAYAQFLMMYNWVIDHVYQKFINLNWYANLWSLP